MINEKLNDQDKVVEIKPSVEPVLPIQNSESTIPAILNKEDHTLELTVNNLNNFESHNTLNDVRLEDDRSKEEIKRDEERREDEYDIMNFSL